MVRQPGLEGFLGGLDYPMYVVTAAGPGGSPPDGCLVGFATQCSIDPPRLLVCLSVNNRTYRLARDASLLGVHGLREDQVGLARLFGEQTGDEVDKLAGCAWHPGPQGAPVLEDSPRRLVGRVLEQVELGDHVGFVLEPVSAEGDADAQPLTYASVRHLAAGHPA